MLGAIIGDIVGSTREWNNVKTEDFELLPPGSHFTDDTVMTLAVAEWLMSDPSHGEASLVRCMQRLGRRYPQAGYGGRFRKWLASGHPQPYGSFGNGSAMRVSPVGLYARSLNEALELARISAAVTHNHPEGIKGAQAVAACIYMKLRGKDRSDIKRYVERVFGYNLSTPLEDIRPGYTFDVSCQGSVPVAIMAFLQRLNAEEALRLAVSMGGDSDTIACITCAIADAEPFYMCGGGLGYELKEQCRRLLPPDLLDINDRFEAFVSRPLYESCAVFENGVYFAGEYPGDADEAAARRKIDQMVHFGVRHFVDLTEEGELHPYSHLLPEWTTYVRRPIPRGGVPGSVAEMQSLLARIDDLKKGEGYLYVHDRRGTERVAMVAACHRLRLWTDRPDEDFAAYMNRLAAELPKTAHIGPQFTAEQAAFVVRYVKSGADHQTTMADRIADSIRGCLMGGAAGDALGYPVEFMSAAEIRARYGAQGITHLVPDSSGRALVSDDTQMTLFTAAGLITGITHFYMCGSGGAPVGYVANAYVDWYCTQTDAFNTPSDTPPATWLRGVPRLYARRAPGTTCMNACHCLLHGQRVENNSKGCGGIMRVAPVALVEAAWDGRGKHTCSIKELAETAAQMAALTHKHPLGFLPAALLTVLLHKLTVRTAEQALSEMDVLVDESLAVLDTVFPGKYEADKLLLKELTRQAVALAHASDVADEEAVSRLGQGWTGEEAWAIALCCALRHADSPARAIAAAVNHDGDSDSTGAIAGNIVGAIHGYRALCAEHLLCPPGRELADVVELADIVLALADDLATECPIDEYTHIDTPARRQWYARYWVKQPAGLG